MVKEVRHVSNVRSDRFTDLLNELLRELEDEDFDVIDIQYSSCVDDENFLFSALVVVDDQYVDAYGDVL